MLAAGLIRAGVFEEFFGFTDPDLPKDVLASKQFQTLIDLISEGVISGFPSATGSQGSDQYNIFHLNLDLVHQTKLLLLVFLLVNLKQQWV